MLNEMSIVEKKVKQVKSEEKHGFVNDSYSPSTEESIMFDTKHQESYDKANETKNRSGLGRVKKSVSFLDLGAIPQGCRN